MRMVKHSQSSQNSKFPMSLQYLEKEVRYEVDILDADKCQSFLQVYFNILGIKGSYKVVLLLLMGMIKYSRSNQSNKFCNTFTISQKKKLWMELQVGIIVFDGSVHKIGSW